ncbi:MAG: hypothetical protein IKH92_01695 [Clostridiales bacterium]|nr:hypothetical protein [Clostridiales bacterium]
MKQLKSYKTTTFADGDFRIDIVEKQKEYEAWIYRHNTGFKNFIWGAEKKTTTFEHFVEVTAGTIDEDKASYDYEIEKREKTFWEEFEKSKTTA